MRKSLFEFIYARIEHHVQRGVVIPSYRSEDPVDYHIRGRVERKVSDRVSQRIRVGQFIRAQVKDKDETRIT